MSSKQLNRRQARWAEFLAEFNFKIAYRPEIQRTKPDSLTRRSQNLPENNNDERQQYNHRILLKAHYLKPEVRKAIEMALALMDEREETIASLAVMLYDLSEERLEADEKSMIESPVKKHLGDDPVEEEQMEEPSTDTPTVQSDIMARIIAAYPNDGNLQRVIEVKRQGFRRIPADIIKTGIRLELGDCEIRENDLL